MPLLLQRERLRIGPAMDQDLLGAQLGRLALVNRLICDS
jgi:hypothetical protein